MGKIYHGLEGMKQLQKDIDAGIVVIHPDVRCKGCKKIYSIYIYPYCPTCKTSNKENVIANEST